MSLKDSIIQSQDLPLTKVEVPEWNCTVYLRTMNGFERDSYGRASWDYDNDKVNPNIQSMLLVRCICDEKGERIFVDNDVELLAKKNAMVLERLYLLADKLNCVTKQSVDDLAKN